MKEKVKLKFDKVLLDECLIRDGATLVGEYEDLINKTVIIFKCKCSNQYKKKFWICAKTSGLFCKSCTKLNTDKKRENTNLELFGCTNPMFSAELKKRQEDAIFKSLGVKNPSQSNIVKDKKKQTVKKNFKYSKSLAYLHPEISKQWHPTKNYREDVLEDEYFPGCQLSPSEFTDGSGYEAWWLCPNTNCSQKCAHEYQQRIADKIGQNQGCPFCNGNQQRCYHNTLAYLHPELSKEWHPTKNYREDAIDGEYFPGSQISPSELSDGGKKIFWWKCLIGCKDGCIHEWEAQVGNRTTAESKCPYCTIGTTKVCIHQSMGHLYPSLLNEWDYDKNKDLDPYKIPFKSAKSANWICKNIKSFGRICNNEYNAVIYHRTNGGACPVCPNKTESKLLDFLKKHYLDVFTQLKLNTCKNINHLPFDFCIPSLKLIIELDGRQHFIHIKLFKNNVEESIQRDIYKMKQAEAEGYKIIRIFQEDVYDNDETWLETNLLPHIKNSDRNPVFISALEDLYDEHIRVYELDNVIVELLPRSA